MRTWTGCTLIVSLPRFWSRTDSPAAPQGIGDEYHYYYNWGFFCGLLISSWLVIQGLLVFLPFVIISILNQKNVQSKGVHWILVVDERICIWWMLLCLLLWVSRNVWSLILSSLDFLIVIHFCPPPLSPWLLSFCLLLSPYLLSAI